MPRYASTCRSIVTAMGISNSSITSRSLRGGEGEILSFDCMNDGFNTHFDLLIDPPHHQVTISSRPQWLMPRNKFATTLRYMTLLNYKLNMGSVDMDMDDGEVRFKTSACFGSAENVKPILSNFMNFHVEDGKKYLEGFAAIRNDNANSETAMRAAGYSVQRSSDSSSDEAAELILRLLRMSMQ